MESVQTQGLAGEPGRRANLRGTEAKEEVKLFLESLGYHVTQRVPIGASIYGTPLVADLVVDRCSRWPDRLIVEVISQESRGSADHKFVFRAKNIQGRYPCPTIVVLVGRGFCAGAVSWLRDEVDGRKLVGVFSLEEFKGWAE